MVDANQQWNQLRTQRAWRAFEPLNLTWIEEGLDAYDFEGHAALASSLDAAIAMGEMLTSFGEHAQLIQGVVLTLFSRTHRAWAASHRSCRSCGSRP